MIQWAKVHFKFKKRFCSSDKWCKLSKIKINFWKDEFGNDHEKFRMVHMIKLASASAFFFSYLSSPPSSSSRTVSDFVRNIRIKKKLENTKSKKGIISQPVNITFDKNQKIFLKFKKYCLIKKWVCLTSCPRELKFWMKFQVIKFWKMDVLRYC